MKNTICVLLLSTLLFSCSKDEPVTLTLQNAQLELFHKGEGNVGASTTENDIITYISSNETIANVSSEGTVTAGIIGNAEILVSDGKESKKCVVKVKPKYTNIEEPFYKDDATRDEVLAANKTLPLEIEDDTQIIYEFNGDVPERQYFHVYVFENNKLAISGMIMPLTSPVGEEVFDFISERYLPMFFYLDMFFFLEKDKKHNVILNVSFAEGTITVLYTKYMEETEADEDDIKASAMSIVNEISKIGKSF